MAIEKKAFVYEILVRLGPDGYQAAHIVDLEQIVDTDNGQVLAENLQPARSIDAKQVGEIIGSKAAELIEQIDRLKAEAKSEAEELTRQIADARQAQAEAERQRDAALGRAIDAQVERDLALKRMAEQISAPPSAEAI